jgi:hypothetical protein
MSNHDQGSRPFDELRQLCVTRWASPSRQPMAWSGSAASLFFQLLPIEMRRQIYRMAVCSQSIHVDLFYGRPKGRKLHSVHYRQDIDMSQPTVWYWWSSLCHLYDLQSLVEDDCSDPDYRGLACGHYGTPWYENAPEKKGSRPTSRILVHLLLHHNRNA